MGINIKIGNKWRIKSDSASYTIYKIGFNKEKEQETELPIGYYSCLDHALKHLINRDIADSDCTSLKEIIEQIDALKQEIDSQLNVGIPDYSEKQAVLFGGK